MTHPFYRKQRTATHNSATPKGLAYTDVLTTRACTLTSLVTEHGPVPRTVRINQKAR